MAAGSGNVSQRSSEFAAATENNETKATTTAVQKERMPASACLCCK
ncbi:hypothetical protein [Aminobacter aminovorans]|nr:hypothetical protein [Aminobacter aminovorans]MDR7224258.1 hypothetical protein [Aminobacter aminovorans]